MAAIVAAEAGAQTLLLERTKDGGRKILISGGGRCNILPATLDETRFVTDSSPGSLRNIVRTWPLAEQRAFFEQDLRIPLVEEPASAKLFPASNRARDVRDALLARAVAAGAQWRPSKTVTGLAPSGEGWKVHFKDGRGIEADRVIVATCCSINLRAGCATNAIRIRPPPIRSVPIPWMPASIFSGYTISN